jgi:CheY-like chemotaxis protein
MRLTDFTLLLVEDDENDIALFQRAFARAALVNPIRIVRDGEEAVRYLQGAAPYEDRQLYPLPSLVLLDLKMPRKSGFEVLSWMREQPRVREIPVVLLTSSQERGDIRRAYALGARAYLVKPVASGDLMEMLKSVGMYWMILNLAPPGVPAGTPASRPSPDVPGAVPSPEG